MNDIINNITKIWDGYTIPFPDTHYLEDVHVYCAAGGRSEARAILIAYQFDEDYSLTPEVMIAEAEMTRMYDLENFFKAPSILCVEYRDRQIWINVTTVYMRACENTGKPVELTHDGYVFIPKEWFKHLIREHAHGSKQKEVG